MKLTILIAAVLVVAGCAGPEQVDRLKRDAESRHMYWEISRSSVGYCADAYEDALRDQWISCGISKYGVAGDVAEMLETNAPSYQQANWRDTVIVHGDGRIKK